MKRVLDEKERARALGELGSTLLVQASAGTGKTSLLAGRVAMLLAARSEPSSIAAITFTERAASELRARVDKFAAALGGGQIPDDLAPLLRDAPLDRAQRDALAEARPKSSELTASTIHAFCLGILQSYAVEARIDPGADVMDADATELAFATVFDTWLERRLGHDAPDNDLVAVMAAQNPKRAVDTLRSLARFRRSHPDARPVAPQSYADAVHEFSEAVSEYRRWINGVTAPDEAVKDVSALEELVEFFASAKTGRLSFGELLPLVHPKSVHLLGKDRRVFYVFRKRVEDWELLVGQGAREMIETAGTHYRRCSELYLHMVGTMADTLLADFFAETDGLVAAFDRFKRDAALLDFDDILYRTRALLRANESVRRELGERYRHILVDEFQDTDPVQAEILFLIGSEAGTYGSWSERKLRPGALFMVGDPKQAIYRFRGADLKSYKRARDAIRAQFPDNIVPISANFRSGEKILAHVDDCFGEPLRRQHGEYANHHATVEEDEERIQSIVRMPYAVQQSKYTSDAREPEARAVAELCARLIGNVKVRRASGDIVACEPGDIALLAPTGTELWIYERELENRGLPVASQAGRNLYRRQEAQDFICLVRALADNRDTLALGALLRGPLVGATERELLDVTAKLRRLHEGAVLRMTTDLAGIESPLVHTVMSILQALFRKRRTTTPHALLSEAIERLNILPSLAGRGHDQRDRAFANLNLLLSRARAYDVRGIKQLAIDLAGEWNTGTSFDEAASDQTINSIDVMTVHKAKGLEWPIVIPINLAKLPDPMGEFFYNAEDQSVHWTFGEIASSTLSGAMQADADETEEERKRLLYVACTRALDQLILPEPSWSRDDSWLRVLDLRIARLKEIRDLRPAAAVAPEPPPVAAPTANEFSSDSERVRAATRTIAWRRPSGGDLDRTVIDAVRLDDPLEDGPASILPVVAAGQLRGIVLHKLMEELLTDQVADDLGALSVRASVLVAQVALADDALPDAMEMAQVAIDCFRHQSLRPYIANLVPEFALYGALSDSELVAARADAVAVEGGRATFVVDWKSDTEPSTSSRAAYEDQLLQYLELLDVESGALVYMTKRQVQLVHRKRANGDA